MTIKSAAEDPIYQKTMAELNIDKICQILFWYDNLPEAESVLDLVKAWRRHRAILKGLGVNGPYTDLMAPKVEGMPKVGWHDENVFSVSYEDIQVLIDRANGDGDIEIRVWRNGKNEDEPFAKMNFDLADDSGYQRGAYRLRLGQTEVEDAD